MELFAMPGGGPRIVCYSADAKGGASGSRPAYSMDQVGAAMDPQRAERMELERRGVKVRDHTRENRRLVREDSEVNRMKKVSSVAEAEMAARDSRPDRFEHVQSKISSGRRASDGAVAPSSSTSGSSSARYREQAPDRVQTQVARKPAVPTAAAAAASSSTLPAIQRNYVKENFDKAPAMHKPARQAKDDPYLAKHKQGEVPQYLVNRKQELAEDKERQRRAALPPEAPPGLRLLPEQERLDTLEALHLKKRELDRVYAGLPMTSTTLATQNRRRALEEQLREVESAMELFSKPKVFVKDE